MKEIKFFADPLVGIVGLCVSELEAEVGDWPDMLVVVEIGGFVMSIFDFEIKGGIPIIPRLPGWPFFMQEFSLPLKIRQNFRKKWNEKIFFLHFA